MHPKLQLKFDANQAHQLQAVESVVRLFEGAPRFEAAFQLGDEIVANLPEFADLPETLLLANLGAIQEGNGIAQATKLEMDQGLGLEKVATRATATPTSPWRWRPAPARPTSTCGRSTSCAGASAGAST